MANAQILGQKLRVLNNSADFYNKPSSLLYHFANDIGPGGETIGGSLLAFRQGDAPVNFFSLLKTVYKGRQDVVLTTLSPTDADGAAVVDASKSRISFNADGTYNLYNPDFEKLAAGQTAELSFTYVVEKGKDNSKLVVREVSMRVTGSNEAPLIVAHPDLALAEDTLLHGQVTATDIDSDNNSASLTYSLVGTNLPADFVFNADGSYLLDTNNAAYQHLAQGEMASYNFSWQATDRHGTTSGIDQVVVTVTGSNDAPLVAAPLSSNSNEDATTYRIELLAGASDVDHDAVLHVEALREANGKGGWSIVDHTLTLDPNYFNALNNGQHETLTFNYRIGDERGASVAQALTVTIDGITDAPSLAVTTAAGERVNEIQLRIASQPAASERVVLTFANLPAGALVFNQEHQDVSAGIDDYSGTHLFTLVLEGNSDVHQNLSVTVTGMSDAGTVIGQTAESVELAYDTASATDQLTFSSVRQNMWGNFVGNIGWHEYVPFLGEAPIAWNAATQSWDPTGADYWRSGKLQLVDVDLNSAQITAVVSEIAEETLDTARAVFNVSSQAVDVVAQTAFQTATNVYNTARTVWSAALQGANQVGLAAFHAAEDAYNTARGIYNAADYVFNVVAKGVYDVATTVIQGHRDYYNSLPSYWPWEWAYKVGVGATLLIDEGIYATAQAAYGLATNVWHDAAYAFDVVAKGAYNAARATFEAAMAGAEKTANDIFKAAENVYLVAQNTYNHIRQDIYNAADGVFKLAQDAYQGVLAAANQIDFEAKMQLQAELFAQVGLQVDFELDLGSVNTNLDYQLTSTTQYNQTTDMLAITPMAINQSTGDSVAFSTISPNAKFYAAILYDIGADLTLDADGHLIALGRTIFDLSPNADGIHLDTTISTNAGQELLATLPGSDGNPLSETVEAGKLVLVDFDSTKLEPFEVPFIEQLTAGIVSIELAFPTIATEGKAATYSPSFYQEGGFVSVDFSEITGTLFNIINAKLDFSPEFMARYGLSSLGEVQSFDELTSSVIQGLLATITDTLDGQCEGIPVFLIDTTDQNNTALLHINTFADDLSTTNANTGSLGFYTSYGESAPVIKVNIDIDQAVAEIVNLIIEATADAISAGATVAAAEAIPTINPLNLSFGIDEVLEMAAVDQATRDEIGKYIDLGVTFEAGDFDTHADVDFSQRFSLSLDDISYRLTVEDGSIHDFTAKGAGAIQLANASQYDVNHDGLVDYKFDLVPTAMFSNDTEIGLSMGYVLDFLKAEFAAGVKLPLGELLGLPGGSWPDIELPMIDLAVGPMLRIEGDLDLVDVDVFESRFALNVGSAQVEPTAIGISDATMFIG